MSLTQYPGVDAHPYDRPSYSPYGNWFEGIRIPCSYDRTVPDFILLHPQWFYEISAHEDEWGKCNDLERRLGRIPNLYHEDINFNANYRSLVTLSNKDLSDFGGEWKADYMMYTCSDEKAGLQRNEFLSGFSDTIVYGDALVFKLKPDVLDEARSAEYLHMSIDFIHDAKTGYRTKQILRKLLEKLSGTSYPRHITALRLPYDGTISNPENLTDFRLVKLYSSEDEHREPKTPLEIFPDLQPYEKKGTFNETDGEIVKLSTGEVDYVMYTCLDEKLGLPLNEATNSGRVRLYGDAFVFKLEKGRLAYLDIDQSFLQDDGTESGGYGGRIVQRLLDLTLEN